MMTSFLGRLRPLIVFTSRTSHFRPFCQSFSFFNNLNSSNPKPADDLDREFLLNYLKNKETHPPLNEQQKLQVIKLEYRVMRENGAPVPTEMDDMNWQRLLEATSLNSRKKILLSLFRREKFKEKRQRNQDDRQASRVDRQKEILEKIARGEAPTSYPGHKSPFGHMTGPLKAVSRSRLARSMIFGIPLVFDFSFEHIMRPTDIRNLIDQLLSAYGENGNNFEPFHMHFCGLHDTSPTASAFEQRAYNLPEKTKFLESMFVTHTKHSYLDLFPRDNLVYLTPDAPHELEKFDPEAVYIVGALVDKQDKRPVTMSKAKREGVRMARLPLDRYLSWKQGSKTLCLDQILRILLTLRDTGDWLKALEHVPKRKLRPDDDELY